MKKTGSVVELDIYAIINTSALAEYMGGEVYKEGLRPIDAKTEDIVITFVAGTDDQFQNGIVVVNAYVNNMPDGSGQLIKNSARCRAVEILGREVIDGLKPTDYMFRLDAMPKTFKAEGTDQYFVNFRINFTNKTF